MSIPDNLDEMFDRTFKADECCEWKTTSLRFQYTTGCNFSFDTDIQSMVFGDDLPLKRCPNCGKRIKYVEE